jgi:hypothetical protein
VEWDTDDVPKARFTHRLFDKYAYDQIPCHRDVYLVSDEYLDAFERYWLQTFDTGKAEPEFPWYVTYAAVSVILDSSLETSWYVDTYTRFHEVIIHVPRDEIVCCVGCDQWDQKPVIFVKRDWLINLHLCGFSTFALVDTVGFKGLVRTGSIANKQLLDIRYWIDRIAERFPSVAFISYGDGLLLKADWRVGMFNSDVKYTYEPEAIVRIIEELRELYLKTFGLSVYAAIAQGANPYHGTDLLHVSKAGNHVSLNSLGIPFEQVTAIEAAAKNAIRERIIHGHELYMDSLFFRSFRMKDNSGRDEFGCLPYSSKILSRAGTFHFANCRALLDAIQWHVTPLRP